MNARERLMTEGAKPAEGRLGVLSTPIPKRVSGLILDGLMVALVLLVVLPFLIGLVAHPENIVVAAPFPCVVLAVLALWHPLRNFDRVRLLTDMHFRESMAVTATTADELLGWLLGPGIRRSMIPVWIVGAAALLCAMLQMLTGFDRANVWMALQALGLGVGAFSMNVCAVGGLYCVIIGICRKPSCNYAHNYLSEGIGYSFIPMLLLVLPTLPLIGWAIIHLWIDSALLNSQWFGATDESLFYKGVAVAYAVFWWCVLIGISTWLYFNWRRWRGTERWLSPWLVIASSGWLVVAIVLGILHFDGGAKRMNCQESLVVCAVFFVVPSILFMLERRGRACRLIYQVEPVERKRVGGRWWSGIFG